MEETEKWREKGAGKRHRKSVKKSGKKHGKGTKGVKKKGRKRR